MKKKYIIPIFVPHRGCQNDCVFCNQKKITGKEKLVTGKDVEEIIEEYLTTLEVKEDRDVEVAYYGGSFTGIPLEEQRQLLIPAKVALDQGKIQGIRLSTRPDYINLAILAFLKDWGVTAIELGVQSLDEEVLRKSKRGHSCQDVYQAVRLIKEEGFQLGLQLMLGLPGDSRETFLKTVEKVISLGPNFIRIYPTLIIKDTILAELYLSGKYSPLALEEAVEICRAAYQKLIAHKIPVIRLGLQTTEEIREDGEILGGPYHPAFRELVEASLMLDKIRAELENQTEREGELLITAHPSQLSQVAGHKRFNLQLLQKEYKISKIKVIGDKNLEKGQINIKFRKNNSFPSKGGQEFLGKN